MTTVCRCRRLLTEPRYNGISNAVSLDWHWIVVVIGCTGSQNKKYSKSIIYTAPQDLWRSAYKNYIFSLKLNDEILDRKRKFVLKFITFYYLSRYFKNCDIRIIWTYLILRYISPLHKIKSISIFDVLQYILTYLKGKKNTLFSTLNTV